MINRKSSSILTFVFAAALTAFSTSSLAEIDISIKADGARATSKRITAVITDINHETRDVTLEGPLGNTITMTAGEDVERLNEFQKGDFVVAQYLSSISGEVREPTEEELALPWVEVDAATIADAGLPPGVAAGQVIRAVVSIEGMNRVSRTVTVLDARGAFHVIGDVNPEKMNGVALGDMMVIIYSQALALTLEKHTPAQ